MGVRGGKGRVGGWEGHQTAERKREENSVQAGVSRLRAVTTKALTRGNCNKKRTAHQSTKPSRRGDVTLSHNIKSEEGTLESLSKPQSIRAPNVYKVWNGRRVSGVAQILLSEAEMLRRYCCCCFGCCRRTQGNRTARVDCTALSIFSSD